MGALVDKFDSIVTLLVLGPLTALRGWVLFVLWGWFLIPLGLPAIGIAHALGIQCIVSLMSMHSGPKTDKDTGEIISISISVSLVWLLMGWIYTLFM